MKTFEERFTAWVDGELTGEELAAFEKELATHPNAAAERESALKLGDLLRTHASAPSLSNPDFFNLQLQQRIAAEQPRERVAPARERGGFFWSIPRLLWTGAASLAIALLLFATIVPPSQSPTQSSAGGSGYFAQVIEAWPSDPGISATTVYNAKDNVTVLWLDGLDYVPKDQLALQ